MIDWPPQSDRGHRASPGMHELWAWTTALLVVFIGSFPTRAENGLAAANIEVTQNDAANTTNSVNVRTTISLNGLGIRTGSNRGDYFLQVGTNFSDDISTGVLMASVAENGRDNAEVTGTNFCTSSIYAVRSGTDANSYYLGTFNAPQGNEYNINISAAFFAYSNWLGGYARNSGGTNGGANNLLTASPGLVLGTHFADKGGGVSIVNLTSLGIDSRNDGVLLVTHGANEDNYALSQANVSNGTWTVYVKDNGSDSNRFEQDPVAFVFVPRTNTSVVSGKFRGDGTPLLFSGTTPAFSITNMSVGTWRLTIRGHAPDSGVLILSAEGGTSENQDNVVSYKPDGNGWIIQSRDLPGNPPVLQTPSGPVASFVFIPTAGISLLAPKGNARLNPSALLQVAVSNAAPGDLTITFYGREAPLMPPGSNFTMVVLPDTQNYSRESPTGAVIEMFIAQTEWTVSNRLSRNIAYLAHLGDIVNYGDINGGPNTTEWRNATNAMYRLEHPTRTGLPDGIPYGMAVGNHDQEPNGSPSGTTTFYNQYFGVSHFSDRAYYGGHYGTNNDNHFDLFSASGLDFIVLYLEYDAGANPAVLAWGNEVLQTHEHRRAIVVSHNMGSPATPSVFSDQGAAIYDAFKANTNLFLMLGGHVFGEGSRQDAWNGNTVHTFISDYQVRENGGSGWMRIMEFSPSNNLVHIQTYTPWLDLYENDSDSEMSFSYNLQIPAAIGAAGAPFQPLGTNTGVCPGNPSTWVWPDLALHTFYEWYVCVTDSVGNITTGPIWRFFTTVNSAPTVRDQAFSIMADEPAFLKLQADDGDGDPLQFEYLAGPGHGLINQFDKNSGTFTYTPARGYRGSDRFTFRVSDGNVFSGVAMVTMNLQNPPDTNSNSLPDAWEKAYGVADPEADNDGDGLSNLAEYLANTNPTNAQSALRIIDLTATNQSSVLRWSSVGGTRYRLQYGGILGPFTDMIRHITNEMDNAPAGVSSTQSFSGGLIQSAPGTARYYRIKVVQ